MAEPFPLVRLLAAATRCAIDELHETLASQGHEGIRPAYGYALVALSGGASTTAQLGTALGVTKQGAAKLVTSLEELGYVERRPDPRDRRAQTISLTARGHDLLDKSAKAQAALERRWARAAGEDAATGLRHTLEHVLGGADADPPIKPVW